MVACLPEIRVTKSGDIITVALKQRYKPDGVGVAHRWRIAGQYSLKQLEKEEKGEGGLKKELVKKRPKR